jgi:hypothetical protein
LVVPKEDDILQLVSYALWECRELNGSFDFAFCKVSGLNFKWNSSILSEVAVFFSAVLDTRWNFMLDCSVTEFVHIIYNFLFTAVWSVHVTFCELQTYL